MSHIHPFWHNVTHIIEYHSSLSVTDFVSLIATYKYLTSKERKPEVDFKAKGYSDAAIAEAEKQLQAKFTPITALDVRFLKPLKYFKFENIGYVSTLLDNYERGQLPFPGSVSEQPAQVMEIFATIQALRSEKTAQEQKRIETDVRHKHKGQPGARGQGRPKSIG